MNQPDFYNGDNIVVTDKNGKMIVRDNYNYVVIALHLEIFSEYCD